MIASHGQQDGRSSKPLIIFTSRCKDYGMTRCHGDPELHAHTEVDPLNGPKVLKARTELSKAIFDHHDLFDAVLMQLTTLYGRSGLIHGPLLTLAQQTMTSSGESGVSKLPAVSNSIMHGTHVDDVANVYVAVAKTHREAAIGQVFNSSSRSYETAAEIAYSVEKNYTITTQLKGFKALSDSNFDRAQMLMDFTQWVSNERLRGATRWTDKKPLFQEDLDMYRSVHDAYAF